MAVGLCLRLASQGSAFNPAAIEKGLYSNTGSAAKHTFFTLTMKPFVHLGLDQEH